MRGGWGGRSPSFRRPSSLGRTQVRRTPQLASSRIPPSEVGLLKRRNDDRRSEVARLREAPRQKLGDEVRFGDAASLRREVDELERENRTLSTRVRELEEAIDAEGRHRIEVEDALSASRDLVKKMTKDGNSP